MAIFSMFNVFLMKNYLFSTGLKSHDCTQAKHCNPQTNSHPLSNIHRSQGSHQLLLQLLHHLRVLKIQVQKAAQDCEFKAKYRIKGVVRLSVERDCAGLD